MRTRPTGVCNGKLQNAGCRHSREPQQNRQIHANLLPQYADTLRSAQQPIELIHHSDAAASYRRDRSAGHS
jgi:hypothetical protein